MSMPALFASGQARVIAALHLPAFPGSRHPEAWPLGKIRDYALRNVERVVAAGVEAVYIQDLGETPHPTSAQPYTTAGMAVIGAALRQAYPDLLLGVTLMSHAPRESLAVVQAFGGQFVRLKVYVGAMVKSEGILQGCAYTAISYRRQIDADDIQILADVYDRTGEPLGRQPLAEEVRAAATFGRADALVLTGRSVDESEQMLREACQASAGVPLLLGGGAAPSNLARFLPLVDGIIVSSAFKAAGGWTRQSLTEEWDEKRIQAFMQAARETSTS